MKLYFILALSIVLASINSTLLHKVDLSENKKVIRFNLGCCAIWTIILFAIGGRLEFSSDIILYGSLYAVIQVFFLIFKAKAMSTGPISLTTLFGNMSLVLSTICGAVIWKEEVSLPQICGILLLVISIITCTYQKKQGESKNRKGWIFNCILFFIFAAAVGIIFKAYSKTGGNINNMMLFAAIIMFLLLLVTSFCTGGNSLHNSKPDRFYILMVIICGIISCLYNRVNIFLSGTMDSIIFFPSFNGGVIILSCLLGIIVFKEKLQKKQVCGMCLGVLSILIIGIC